MLRDQLLTHFFLDSYIRSVRWLHEMTQEPELQDHFRDALEYEFTFKFCCNLPIKVPP